MLSKTKESFKTPITTCSQFTNGAGIISWLQSCII